MLPLAKGHHYTGQAVGRGGGGERTMRDRPTTPTHRIPNTGKRVSKERAKRVKGGPKRHDGVVMLKPRDRKKGQQW